MSEAYRLKVVEVMTAQENRVADKTIEHMIDCDCQNCLVERAARQSLMAMPEHHQNQMNWIRYMKTLLHDKKIQKSLIPINDETA